MDSELSGAPAEGADVSLVSDAGQAPAPAPASAPERDANGRVNTGTAREAIADAMRKAGIGQDNPAEAQPEAKLAGERPRAPDGKFAPKTDAAPDAAQKPAEGQQQPQPATDAAPPSRLSKAAQEAWQQTPDVVRTEVARMERELVQGIDKYKTAFEPIKHFDDMAKAGGTTLDKALESYVGIEKLLRDDPVKGMVAICQNMNVDPRAMAQALFGAADPNAPAQGQTPEVAALKAEIAALKEQITGVSSEFRSRDTRSAIEKFASERPDFDALAEPISHMLQTGFAKDLQAAYDMARRLHPELAHVPPEEKAQPAHTRKAAMSITGTPPTAGSNPASRKNGVETARDTLLQTFAQHGINI